MKRSLAAATLAGALMLAPMATANAQPAAPAPAAAEQATPVSGCATIPPSAPNKCSWFHQLGELLTTGSSALGSGSKAK
ncbi:hypothetical protein [Nocardia sp. XZ_19_385]|uniref:hypothetical protein n=1 Tax=Nocardia sp. XZ_19_385 TaxID=2769488 RepID=UPI00188E8A4B|nr:hypothetical protein [Nocardia sp. XZ_19_385]